LASPSNTHGIALQEGDISPLLVDTCGAAKLLQMSPSWLEHDRQRVKPEVPFVRIGARTVRYRISDLSEYAAGKVRGAAA
jgi:hypothetical protein